MSDVGHYCCLSPHLRRYERDNLLPVHQGKEGGLLALQELLYHKLVAWQVCTQKHTLEEGEADATRRV